ncbi:CoA-binding protein [Desulforhopalus sp. 52FAK]
MQSLESLNSDNDIAELLETSKSIAIVGLSPKEQRPSNMVGRYLIESGYSIYPINPGQDEILGLTCYSDVLKVPEAIDIVDIFRKSEDVLAVVQQVVKLKVLPKAIWMQQGIINKDAASLAREHGILVVMDRCIKIDHNLLLRA